MQIPNKTAKDVVQKVKRTVSSILWDKFLDSVEASSWGSLALAVLRVLLSIVLAVSLFDIPFAIHLFAIAWKWGDFAIPKTFAAFVLVFGWRVWFGWLASLWSWVSSLEFSPAIREEVPSWYGIPVVELVEYLFAGDGSFVRSDVEARFALPRNRFDKMAKEMDEVKIFVRGDNNSRKLNPDFSREDISSMIFRAVEVGELRSLHRKENANTWTSSPSMPSLVASSESPSQFTRRPLSSEIPTLAS